MLYPLLVSIFARLVGLESGLSSALFSALASAALRVLMISATLQDAFFRLTFSKSSSKVTVTTFRLDKSRAQVRQFVVFLVRVGFVTISSIELRR